MLSAFGQSRIDSNSYKRIHYLDYAQVTQDVFYSLGGDTAYGNGNKFLNIDTIYYAFNFEPYPDELKKKIIRGGFNIYLLNEINDTIYNKLIELSDSQKLAIPIAKKNKYVSINVVAQTSIKKKHRKNGSFKIVENKILRIGFTNPTNLNIIRYGIYNVRCGIWLKPTNNTERVLRLYGFPIDDIVKKTIPGVY